MDKIQSYTSTHQSERLPILEGRQLFSLFLYYLLCSSFSLQFLAFHFFLCSQLQVYVFGCVLFSLFHNLYAYCLSVSVSDLLLYIHICVYLCIFVLKYTCVSLCSYISLVRMCLCMHVCPTLSPSVSLYSFSLSVSLFVQVPLFHFVCVWDVVVLCLPV